MDLQTQFAIKSNPYIQRYLLENSYWYKYLTRNPNLYSNLEKEMREAYRMTMKDKIEDIGKRIEMIKSFMDILR